MAMLDDIVSALVSSGVGVANTTIFLGAVRDQTIKGYSVWVLPTGGAAPIPDIAGSSGADLRMTRVQVRVRGDINAHDVAYAKALATFTALHKQQPAGYVSWLCDEPVYLGLDQGDRSDWSVNVTVTTYG